MLVSRRRSLGILVIGFAVSFTLLPSSIRAVEPLPSEISDKTFWEMVTSMSEPDGYFQFENFLSNELGYQYVIPRLLAGTKPGGVYLGVAPEQNFTYIAALKPRIAFITDIRRQNTIELLMYKACFELSETRADFLSMLFARKRPEGLTEKSTASELFTAFSSVRPDADFQKANLEAIQNHLVKTHGFELRPTDIKGFSSIEYVYSVFVQAGPYLDYSTGGRGAGANNPTYEDLMTIDDGGGTNRSFMANEENYRFVRDMQKKNLIVPLVGDFSGVKTIKAIGQYLKDHDATVTAFYLSNVEQYLFQSGSDARFYKNVAELPLDGQSTFIRTFSGGGFGGFGGGGAFRFVTTLSSMKGLLDQFNAGRVRSYADVRDLSQ